MRPLSELFGNVVFQTVIAGVLVFAFSEMLQKFLLEPIKEFKGIIGKIDNRLKFFANVISNATPSSKMLPEVNTLLRQLSCDLESAYKMMPFKWALSILRMIPSQKQIASAAKGLIFVSNATGEPSQRHVVEKEVEKVRNLLRIPKYNGSE